MLVGSHDGWIQQLDHSLRNCGKAYGGCSLQRNKTISLRRVTKRNEMWIKG